MKSISGSTNVLRSISGRFSLLTVFLFCFLFQLDLKGAPAPVEVKGLNASRCIQVFNGLLVYGRMSNENNVPVGCGYQVNLYDNDLKLIGTYSKQIKGFTPYMDQVFYCGKNDIEFFLHDVGKNTSVIIRLDSSLKEIFVSDPFERSKERDDSVYLFNYRHLSKTVSYYRWENQEWEIKVDSISISGGKKILKSFLRMGTEIQQKTFPQFRESWKLELGQTAPEYAKFLYSENGRIYFYVNFKTETGEQYLYCVQNSDGKLIYKTKLTLAGVKSSIYSNFFNDSKNKKLIVSGTCLYGTGKKSDRGIFIIQLDQNGKISGSYNEAYRRFSFPKPDSTFSKNSLSDSRIVSMVYNTDGSFSVFIEAYAMVLNKLKDNNGVSIKLSDSLYHYFMLEKMTFKISPTTISMICSNCEKTQLEYNGQVNVNDIANYNQLKFHISGYNYPDNINVIVDPHNLKNNANSVFENGKVAGMEIGEFSVNTYFVGSALDENTKQTKVLVSYFSIANERFSNDYFSSESTGQNNFDAYQYLVPVAGQNMNEEKSYFIRDSKTLLRFRGTQTGYKLEIVTW